MAGNMSWRDLVDKRNSGAWRSLLLQVPFSRRRAPLHIQSDGHRLIRLEADGGPVLWARVSDDHYGYAYLRAKSMDHSPAVVPPISFDRARALDPASAT